MDSGHAQSRDGAGPAASAPHLDVLTPPSRRSLSTDLAARLSIRTPGSRTQTPAAAARGPRLSASARKPAATTPHGRAALRALDSRRAAIYTPHRDRRRSLREQRATPRADLRGLSRLLAPATQPIPSSSSSSAAAASVKSETGGGGSLLSDGDDDDDEDDERPLRAPRLSLPIGWEGEDGVDDEEDDDVELRPYRAAGLEDDNFTMQSIEMPRRALGEHAAGRMSLANVRVSDVFAPDGLRSDEAGIDSAFFPPRHAIDEDGIVFAAEEEVAYERIDEDGARRETARESDFGIAIPVDGNESTFMMSAQAAEELRSPVDQPLELSSSPPAPLLGFEDGFGSDDVVAGDLDMQDGLQAEDEDGNVSGKADMGITTTQETTTQQPHKKKKPGVKRSKYGIVYPSLPAGVVKRLAQTFAQTSGAKGKISPDTLAAVMQASEWFFEQLGDDLQAYAKHAGRKTIDESDVLTLMRRQRQVNSSTTPFSLAQRYLPREMLQQLRMPAPAPAKKGRKAKQPAGDPG